MSGIQIFAAVASALAAWMALLLSVLNFFTSRKALRLSEQQEARRKPSIVPYLQEGYVAVGAEPGSRVYAILVSLSNRSDNNNSIASAVLHLTYVKQSGTQLTIKVRAESEPPAAFNNKSTTHLRTPTRLDAHQTLSGWCFFKVDDSILEGSNIDRTQVTLLTTTGTKQRSSL